MKKLESIRGSGRATGSHNFPDVRLSLIFHCVSKIVRVAANDLGET